MHPKSDRLPDQRLSLSIYSCLLILTLLACGLLARCIFIVDIDMDSSAAGTMTVNWRETKDSYTDFNLKQVNVQQGHHLYWVILWSLGDVDQLAIKPVDTAAKVSLNKIVIRTFGNDPLIYNNSDHFHNFRPLAGIIDVNADNNQLKMRTLGKEALLEFDVIHAKINTKNAVLIDKINIKVVFIAAAMLITLGIYFTVANAAWILLAILVAGFYFDAFPADYAVINIELQAPRDDQMTVYWAAKHAPYTELQSRQAKTFNGTEQYRFGMANLNDIQHIRIDPIASIGQVFIKQITVSAFVFEPIVLNARNQFYAVDFSQNKRLKLEGDALVFSADTNDDFFELFLNIESFRAGFVLKSYLVFVGLLLLLRIGSVALKLTHLAESNSLDRNGFKVGCIIIVVMLLQYILAPHYAFFVDYQANELVVTHAGETAELLFKEHARQANVDHIAHIGLINLAYFVVAALSLLLLSVFTKLENAIYLAAFMGVCTIIGYAIKDKDTLIQIEMESSVANRLKVYWADEAELYQEQHSASVNTQTGKHFYTLAMANLNNIHNIRIEPINVAGNAAITQISINEVGFEPILLNARNYFYAVDRILKTKSKNKETTEKLTVEQDKLIFKAAGNDRFFELVIEPEAFKAPYPPSFYLQFGLLLSVVFASIYFANRQFGIYKKPAAIMILRVSLLIVVVMIVQMAWLSEYDAHPDEKAHIDSIDYYTQYSTPPVVGDERALNAYQYPWGVSRLDDLGISYWVMGKLKNLITLFAEDTVITCRVFNSLLIVGLLWLTRHQRFALYLMPLLCLPQVWHLFSYANRDAFALWLAILMGWQLANQDSALNRYLKFDTDSKAWRNLLFPALLLGILSIEITNYIIFILYVIGVFIWQGLFLSGRRKQFAVRCLIFLLMAGSLYGVRKTADIAQNGFNKQAQRIAYAEMTASPDFKPSVANTEAGYFGLRLKEKGVAAATLFAPRWEWQVLTYKSFTGLYGNEFAEYSPEWYYTYVGYLFSLIALVLILTAMIQWDLKLWVFTAMTAIFVLGDILMGFLYSWTYDFQPQGRYIFPLIPVLMVYLFKVAPLWGNKVKALLLTCATLLFVLGLFSFRYIALTYLVT